MIEYIFYGKVSYNPKIHGNIDIKVLKTTRQSVIVKLDNSLLYEVLVTWKIDNIPIEKLNWYANVTRLFPLKDYIVELKAIIVSAMLTKGNHVLQVEVKGPSIRITKEVPFTITD